MSVDEDGELFQLRECVYCGLPIVVVVGNVAFAVAGMRNGLPIVTS